MQVNHQWFVSFAVAMSVFASCRNCAFGRPRILFHLLYGSLREHLRFQFVCINLANRRFGRLVALDDGIEHGRLVVKRRFGKEMLFEQFKRLDV